MAYDFEIIEKEVELTIKIYYDAYADEVDMSRSDPLMKPAYDAYIKALQKKGWADKNEEFTMDLVRKTNIVDNIDGISCLEYTLRLDTPSEYLH